MKPQHMYRKILLSSLFLFFLSVTYLHSQERNTSNIVGSWIFDAKSSFDIIDQQTADFMSKNPQFRTQIQAAYVGKTITFFSNGAYTQVLGDRVSSSGKWTIEKNALQMVSSNGAIITYAFTISGSGLVLTIPDKSSKSVVPYQYFTKR